VGTPTELSQLLHFLHRLLNRASNSYSDEKWVQLEGVK
jgi:hypothetical protein